MDFKVSYLDAGLTNSYFADAEQLVVGGTAPTHAGSPTGTASSAPQRVNRRYKTQLRDFLSTCRTKRKLASSSASPGAATPGAAPAVDYVDTSSVSAAAVAAAYSNLNNMYGAPYATPGAAATTAADAGLGSYMGHSATAANFHQSLYPGAALDNRFLATENLFHQYRPLGSYYPDYHAAAATPYVGNGFLDMSPRALPSYEHVGHHHAAKEDKLYPCQQLAGCKMKRSPASSHSGGSSPAGPGPGPGLVTPKLEDLKPEVALLEHEHVYGDAAPRQTVLMWGSAAPSAGSTPSPPALTNGTAYRPDKNPLKSLAEMNSGGVGSAQCKWAKPEPASPSHKFPSTQHSQHVYSDAGSATEVWPVHQYQYYPYTSPYHHHAPQ